ncbi:MAG: VWA domain-containing protein [Hyphomicrobiaceae bacterium]|nr:VWA domain-containing protein [Hyphomicrobiaceae bacterium]
MMSSVRWLGGSKAHAPGSDVRDAAQPARAPIEARRARRGARAVIGAAARDTSGVVSLLFGLMVVVLLATIGAGVDAARWFHARSLTVGAVDAGVLAGARILQTDGLATEHALAMAMSYYNENVRERDGLVEDTISFTIVDHGTAVTAEGAAHIETVLLKLIGINRLPLFKAAGSEFSKAVLAVGANADQSLEISLMLDVTGSMAGQRLQDLKDAAKDLIDIVVWEGGGQHTSRLALVPFSAGVNASSLPVGVVSTGNATRSFNTMNGRSTTMRLAAACASERAGADAYTDAAPVGGALLGRVYNPSGACEPANPVVPLSNNKAHLKSVVDGFVAVGSTAGHIGTAWAWYMLSPNWAPVLPPDSVPASYSVLSQRNEDGKPVLEKIAVLMTDGEYNTQYCTSGIRDRNSNGSSNQLGTCTAANGSSAAQARSLCAAMKAKGVTVYTVGFQISAGSEAAETLNQCATDPGKAYMAENGEELKQSFRSIALKISDLYLSQ